MIGRRPRSLIARILVAEAVAIAIVALLLPWLLTSVLRTTTRGIQRDELIEQARVIADAIVRDDFGHVRAALPAAAGAIYASRYDGRAFVIVGADGRQLAASPFARLAPWRAAPRGSRPIDFRAGPFLGLSLPVADARGPLWVVVTQDDNGPGAIVDDIVDTFLPRYSVVLLAVLVALSAVNALAIRRVVVSLHNVADRAAAIGVQTLDRRLDAGRVPSEVEPLVAAINALLDRLHQSFRQQGEFVGNVAHELRTPVATLKLRVEMVEDAGLREVLDRQCERVAHVVSQLHDLASLEVLAQDTMSAFDPADLAREIVQSRTGTLRQAGIALELAVDGPAAVVRANRFLVGVALANLVDNVARHTPAGTAATVRVAGDGSITVEDDGPGFAPSDGAPRRFWRAGHVRSDSAGLGLSIVRRIMDVHGGTLRIGNRAPHGARITLDFDQRV